MPSYKLRDISNDYLKPVVLGGSPPPPPVTPPPPPVAWPPQPQAIASVPVTVAIETPQPSPRPEKGSNGFLIGMLVGAPLLFFLGIAVFNNHKEDSTPQDSVTTTSSTATDATTGKYPNIPEPTVATEAVSTEGEGASAVADTEATEPPANVETVAAPQLTQGMKWDIKTTDYKDPKSSYPDVQYLVTQANQMGYTFQKGVVGRASSLVDLSYDTSLNLVGGRTGQYTPALHYYDFPLWVGKSWNVKSDVSNNTFKDVQNANGTVKGWETLSTAFGDIKTLKIVVNFISYKEGVEVSRGLDVSWYSPDLGRAVQSEEYYWDAATSGWVKGREHHVFAFTKPSN